MWILVILIVIGLLLGWVSTSGVKPQWVRLVDVFVYGPLLIYAGYLLWNVSGELNKWIAGALVIIGASTITYNLRNYLHESRSS